MGLKQKLNFIKQHPDFFLKLGKIKYLLYYLKKRGKQTWVFQCDFKGHFPYLKPFFEYSKKISDVAVFFAIGYLKKHNPKPFLIDNGVSPDRIIQPIDCLRYTEWDVYMSPTEWGNVFPGNHDALRVQIFHTLADKKIEYSKELLKFNIIFANGPIHHTFLDKYIYKKYPEHKDNCKVLNTGFAKIDDLFDGTYSKSTLKKKIGISKEDNRPIVLYAPNWEATSSLCKYGEDVFKYLVNTNCIALIKLHYMSLIPLEDHNATLSSENHPCLKKEWIDWNQILNKYKQYENIRIIEEQSLNPWLYLSDLMITDYGGASLEFICTGKPVIYLDCPEFFDMRGYDIFEYEGRKTGYIIDDIKLLPDTIENVLNAKLDVHANVREDMRKNLIYNAGCAAEEGFKKVYELVHAKKKGICTWFDCGGS